MKKNTFILFLTFFTTTKAFCQPSCKSLSTTQELLNILKDKPVTNINYTSFVNECNVNDLVKNRLLYLIDWRWTKIEIDSYLENYFNSNKDFLNIAQLSKNLSGDSDSLYKRNYDSIKQEILKVELNELNTKFYVDGSVFKAIAFANIKIAIPKMQLALKDKTHYNTAEIELSLARLGDIRLQQKIISECKYKKELEGNDWVDYFRDRILSKLIFVSTQESIYKINEWLDTSKIYQPTVGRGEVPKAKSALIVMSFLKGLIQNKDFQNLFQNFKYNIKQGYMDNTLILKCKTWLQYNRGRYLFNKYYLGGDIEQVNFR